MNLIGEPWIPVTFQDGTAQLAGLQDVFGNAEKIRDLNLNPPQRISVMRLLLCITQAALDGPEDESDWLSCCDRIVPESLDYLSQRQHKFDLFGSQPFLQVRDLEPLNNATLDKLDFGLASGNNTTLFDQAAIKEGRSHSRAWMALMLLTYQCFSPGGRIGVSSWAGKKTGTGASEHAPCAEASLMHSILRGTNLLESMHLNLLTKEEVNSLPNGHWGKPVWDQFPSSQDDKVVNSLTHSYLGRLVPLSRGALMSHPDSKTLTLVNALTYPKLPASREPMGCVVVRGKGENQVLGYLRINLSRHPWRELGSLLNLNRKGVAGAALALDHLRHMSDRAVDLWVGGLATRQGKIIDVAEWNLAVPPNLLNTSEIEKYQKGTELAMQGEASLGSAVKEYGRYLNIESQVLRGLRHKATSDYWTTLDRNCGRLVEIACDSYAHLGQWANLVFSSMLDAYRLNCAHETARQIQAFARGDRLLRIKRQEG